MPPPALLLLSLILMVGLHLAVPVVALPVIVRWSGIAPLVAGIVINLVADRQFHRARTPVKPWLPTTTLMTDGVFAWTRNPMYLGFVLILGGVWLLMGSVSPGVVVALFAVAMNRFFIPPEEEKLSRTFGETFEAYRRRVRRWI
jgi:protein-S-isoprenylcysteine O-methyltransferase Ste14